MKPTEKEIRILRRQIRHHDIMYRRGEPEISDSEYDAMFRMLQKWEERWPEFLDSESPTQTVEHVDDGSEPHWYDWQK